MTTATAPQSATTPAARLQEMLGRKEPPAPSRPETWLRQPLDNIQERAVQAAEGPVIIFGGPGTGKTHTMRERALDLIRRGASPGSVCLLAFSGYTAGVLQQEISDAAGADAASLGFFIGTFHKFCAWLLRRHAAEAAGVQGNFSIWDSAEAQNAMSLAVNGNAGDGGLLAYLVQNDPDAPEDAPNRMTDGEIARLHQWHSHNRNHGPDRQRAPAHYYWPELIQAYEQEKRRQNAVDFDDLIHLAIAALENSPAVRQRCARLRTRHLFVDEFQDLGIIHYDLIRMLVGPTSSITVVGDPNQSIYGWRGAEPALLERFLQDYPQCDKHMLLVNHRSTGSIVSLSRSINSSGGFAGLNPDFQRAVRSAGEPVRIMGDARTPHDQYREITREIRRLVQDGLNRQPRGPGYDDIGIIYRSSRTKDKLVPHMEAANVPYHVIGAPPLRRSRAVSAAIALLELAVNPWNSLALSKAGNPDIGRGLGQRMNSALLSVVRETSRQEKCDLIAACERNREEYVAGSDPRRQLEYIARSGAAIRETLEQAPDADHEPAWPETLLNEAYQRLHQAADPGRPGGAAPDAADTSLERALLLARRYRREHAQSDQATDNLAGFLEFLAEAGSAQNMSEEHADPTNAPKGVTLSTVHASKGRQFQVAFFADLTDQITPGEKTRPDSEYMREEERLFYVGCSRALNLLYMCYPQQAEDGQALKPSRFLAVLDQPAPETDEDENASR